METTTSKQRDSGFELLRIICIIGIIGHHYYVHGAGCGDLLSSEIFYRSGITAFGNVGVAAFLLISGWFVSTSNFSIKKVLRLVGTVYFYSIVCLVIAAVCKFDSVTPENIRNSIFPFSTHMNWYAGNYIIGYCFTPFIKKSCIYFHEHKDMYFPFIGLISLITAVMYMCSPHNGFVNDITWVLYLFYMGDFIRYMFEGKKISIPKCVIGIVIIKIIENIYYYIVLAIMETNVNAIADLPDRLEGRYGMGTLLIGILLVLIFSQVHFTSKIINKIASVSFGLYLIHDSHLIRDYIWFDILKVEEFKQSPLQPLHNIFCIVIIFAVCGVIELIRMGTIEKLWMKLVGTVVKRFSKE